MEQSHFQSASRKEQSTSLYGQDLLEFIEGYDKYPDSAFRTAVHVVTHGGRYPIEQAVRALGFFDAAAFETLQRHPELPIRSGVDGEAALALYVNSLGRLHIRRAGFPRPEYDPDERVVDIGYVEVPRELLDEIDATAAAARTQEAAQFGRVKAAVDRLHERGLLADVLERVIDHVEHVESVCFYVEDRFYALIDRFVNLIDTKGGTGYLPGLRNRDYAQWPDEAILIVAALHALFISGRSVRFEEFNGIALTARGLWQTFERLLQAYREAGCEFEVRDDADLFDVAQIVRDQTYKAIGKDWLRYRWIYGLNFQKSERVLKSTRSSEAPAIYLDEFGADYDSLLGQGPDGRTTERRFFLDLAEACLERDVRGVPCTRGSAAAAGWLEYLREKIVGSAVLATDSDYGMSSSIRDIAQLIHEEEEPLLRVMNALTPTHFFTCFVSRDFGARLPAAVADVIASSVQKRMMFNRWHFFPGNFERDDIAATRHWYYPPLIPDIAIHSDVHRAAHNRARVKYSVRAPGPDMSRPALVIGGQRYRGFYDVRVVRMEGSEFTTEDILRTRRRTLWMECVYAVLVEYLETRPPETLAVRGFQPGKYLDIDTRAGGLGTPAVESASLETSVS